MLNCWRLVLKLLILTLLEFSYQPIAYAQIYSKMEEKFIKTVPSANWSDCTFIFSCVSAGNVSQLATE